ncbi:MAG: hypothetical protein P8R39_03885 [Alphaproteobacteria bacterium]|nr:hypothetical protein [Alphaproteobacteria bacterium]
MSFFRFAGNIAEGARQSDEKARGRRAKAIEAYDAFVRNNPEATLEDLQGRRGALSDGENYLFNALPDDPSIATQVERNENRSKIRKEAETITRLEQEEKRSGMIDARAHKVIMQEVAKRFGKTNPSPWGDADRGRVLGEIEGSLPEALQEDFKRLYGDSYDFTAARQKAQMALMKEAAPYVEMASSLNPESIETLNMPAHLKPFALDIAKRRKQKIDDDRRYAKADDARKDAAATLAQTRHDANQLNIQIDREIAANRYESDRIREALRLAEDRKYKDKVRTQGWDREDDRRVTLDDRHAKEQERLRDIQRKTEELQRQKAALATATKQQEELIASTQANLAAAISASDLNDAEKEHATNNLAALSATYHIPSTMYDALAKMAIEGEDDIMPIELYNQFTTKYGQLRKRSSIISDAAAGITRAPQRMVAKLDDTGNIKGAEPGSFTGEVVNKITVMQQRMNDLISQASNLNAGTLAQRKALVKRHTEQIQRHIDSASPSSTSDYDASVIQELSAQVQQLRDDYDTSIHNLKPAQPVAPPNSSAASSAQNSSQPPPTTSARARHRGPMSTTVNRKAALPRVQKALSAFYANPNATRGSGLSKRKLTLEDHIVSEFNLNRITDGHQINALMKFARAQTGSP